MRRFRKGQGTLEYVIIFAVIVGAIVVVARLLKPKVGRSFNTIGTRIRTMLNR